MQNTKRHLLLSLRTDVSSKEKIGQEPNEYEIDNKNDKSDEEIRFFHFISF